MSRARAYIPLPELLASALADKLSQAVRDELRHARVPAQTVIRMFTPDHVILHAHDGEDKWWNLTMTLRGPELKAKDANDTRAVAKGRRIQKKLARHRAVLQGKATGEIPAMPQRRTRTIPARVNPWPPKGSQKFRHRRRDCDAEIK